MNPKIKTCIYIILTVAVPLIFIFVVPSFELTYFQKAILTPIAIILFAGFLIKTFQSSDEIKKGL